MGKEDKDLLGLFLLDWALSDMGSQERADFHPFSGRESLLDGITHLRIESMIWLPLSGLQVCLGLWEKHGWLSYHI